MTRCEDNGVDYIFDLSGTHGPTSFDRRNRSRSSIADMMVRAMKWPTPGMVALVEFKRTGDDEVRIYKDQTCIGDIYRDEDILNPGQHYYIIWLSEDYRGRKKVRNRSLFRQTVDHWIATPPVLRLTSPPNLKGHPPHNRRTALFLLPVRVTTSPHASSGLPCIAARRCPDIGCQSALKFDPLSACNIDPPEWHGGGCPGSQQGGPARLRVALCATRSEAGAIAESW